MTLEPVIAAKRLQALRSAVGGAGLDAVAVAPGANLQYLTGGHFYAMERPTVLIVPAEGECQMILPVLEQTSWTQLDFPAGVHIWTDNGGYTDAFAAAASRLRAKRIGVEGMRMRVFEELALKRAWPGSEIVDAHHEISAIRRRKDPSEIDLLRRAIAISESALSETLKAVRVGMSEREVEAILKLRLFSAGADALSFSPIVLAGAQSAAPHGVAGKYIIHPGDALMFDFGASVGGYNADITRTFFVGEPTETARRLYETVQAANRLGREVAKPGITAGELDDAVLSFLESSALAEGELIKTGHGLGLEVHEAPQIMRGNQIALEPGMVITIEPALYRFGLCGIRIEDDMLVTESGAESLTTFPRDLQVLQ